MRCKGAISVIVSGVLLSACDMSPGVDLEAERAALRAAADAYHEAAGALDVDSLVDLYANDGLMIPPNAGEEEGLDDVRSFATAFTQAPGLEFHYGDVRVEVAASGDMGYTLEEFVISVEGPDGQPVEDQLRDFHLWKKQDGEWKVAIDIWNSALPLLVPEDTSEADREAISDLHDREMEAYFAGDVEAVTTVFTENVVTMPPNEPVVQGTEALEAWSRNLLSQVSIQGDVEVTDIALAGDWAIERYEYDFEVSPIGGGDAVEEEGKGIHVLRRQPDGTWKIAVDIWNANGPSPSSP